MKKSHVASFQFSVYGEQLIAKISNTRPEDVIKDCQLYFHFDAISDIIMQNGHKNSSINIKTARISIVQLFALYDNDFFI